MNDQVQIPQATLAFTHCSKPQHIYLTPVCAYFLCCRQVLTYLKISHQETIGYWKRAVTTIVIFIFRLSVTGGVSGAAPTGHEAAGTPVRLVSSRVLESQARVLGPNLSWVPHVGARARVHGFTTKLLGFIQTKEDIVCGRFQKFDAGQDPR